MKLLLVELKYTDTLTKIVLVCILLSGMLNITAGIVKKSCSRASVIVATISAMLFLVTCVHMCIYHLYNGLVYMLMNYGVLYLCAFISCIWSLLIIYKKDNHILDAVFAASILACLLISVASVIGGHIRNMSHMSYREAFMELVDDMKENYVLSSWKQIDYDAIVNEVMPLVEKAQQDNDPVLYGVALYTYAYYFYDGHVTVKCNEQYEQAVRDRLMGNDYGLSMLRLSSGCVVAVDVDESSELSMYGITNGTVITAWDGQDIDAALESVRCIGEAFPVKENEDFFKPLYLAGKGGEAVRLSFIDKDGKEKTIEIKSRGSYYDRYKYVKDRLMAVDKAVKENYYHGMLTDDIGYIRIHSEFLNAYEDVLGFLRGDSDYLREKFNDIMRELKEAGMTRLVIDLRNNTGGMDVYGAVVASFFNDVRKLSYGTGYMDGDRLKIEGQTYIEPDGEYKDMPVIVLVNAMCMSAGDAMAYDLGKCDNVMLIGMTCGNGCDQNFGAKVYMPDSEYIFKYPNRIVTDENGEIRIDTDVSRTTRVVLDKYIPIDNDALKIIFDTDEDYELSFITDNYDKLWSDYIDYD